MKSNTMISTEKKLRADLGFPVTLDKTDQGFLAWPTPLNRGWKSGEMKRKVDLIARYTNGTKVGGVLVFIRYWKGMQASWLGTPNEPRSV